MHRHTCSCPVDERERGPHGSREQHHGTHCGRQLGHPHDTSLQLGPAKAVGVPIRIQHGFQQPAMVIAHGGGCRRGELVSFRFQGAQPPGHR